MIKQFLFLAALFLILPSCSAVQFDMKSSYNLGETIIAKVSGNFAQPISEEDISFYRRHMQTSMVPYLSKIGSDYYISSQIPLEKIADNYSIVIKGAKYFQGNGVKEEDIFYNFSITNKTADFSIDPAIIKSNADFEIAVQNFQDKAISVKTSLTNKTSSSGGFFSLLFGGAGTSRDISTITLSAGETKKIKFNLSELEDGLNTIRISSDNLEYFVFADITKKKEEPNFYFEKSEMNISSRVNLTEKKKIFISNPGNESIKNVSLSLSTSLKDYANISNNSTLELKGNSLTEIELSFFSPKEINLSGFLKAESEDKERILAIYFGSLKDYIPVEEESSKTCSELNGNLCGVNVQCNGTVINAKDDRCCMGNCIKEEGFLSKKFVGWSLLIISLLVFFWFLTTKYKGAVNRVNFFSGRR